MRGVRAGLLLLVLLVPPVAWQDMPVIGAVRLAWLDTYQLILPRERRSAPTVIVAIDEASLNRFGQWPWPRNLVARLIDQLRTANPAAIGIDILFAEPDRLSADRLASLLDPFDPRFAERSTRASQNDLVLAASIRAAPVVLGIAGIDVGISSESAPFTPSLRQGADASTSMLRYSSALRSLAEIDSAARGHGLLSAETEAGVVRRVPMVALIGTNPVLPLSLEMLRVASGEPYFAVRGNAAGLESVAIGNLDVPIQNDGRLWVHYTPHDANRFVSAADVLTGDADTSQFDSKLVLLGVTGLGLIDYQTTPLGERMPGIEIHAQVLENIFDGELLARPRWAPWAEGVAFLLLGVVVIYSVQRVSPVRSILSLALLLVALGALGLAAYWSAGLLVDASVPGTGLLLLFAAMLAETLSEANAQRLLLQARLQRERESAARLAGELDAARRIQIGILPRSDTAFSGERRFEISASMEPAREVGGDLYDFFMLDQDRLFFMVGDVSGKGLLASIFMAVSKALCKSAALRRGQQVGELLREAGGEIARENPESLFVTVFAGILDARTGRIEYCGAGHEPPFVISPEGQVSRFGPSDGPPLCVLDGFPYTAAEYRMEPGTTLCLVSDGVTEAVNASGELYGANRLRSSIERARGAKSAVALVGAIRTDVTTFVAGADPADDITLLVLRWNAPSAR